MRVLVTGGAGFIGSVVVAQLLADGQEVVVYDDLSKGHRRAVSAKAELIVGKLEDITHLSSVFQKYKFDAVMHFAASIEAGESMKTPTRYFRNNTAIPAIEEGRRPGDPAILVASSDKIRLELGWKPQYTELGAIVSSAWNWFQRHPNGYVD